MITIAPGIFLDERDLHERFIRASGPGGQNVNKVATAVELRFNIETSSLPDDVKERLLRAGRQSHQRRRAAHRQPRAPIAARESRGRP